MTPEGRNELKRFLLSEDAHPLTLHWLMQRIVGKDYAGYEPETVQAEVMAAVYPTVPREQFQDDPKARVFSSKNWSKLQAVRTILSVNSPNPNLVNEDMRAFGITANSISGDTVDLEAVPSPFEVALTMDIMVRLKPEYVNAKTGLPFSNEVLGYVAAVLFDSGIVYGLGVLDPANTNLGVLAGNAQNQAANAFLKGTTDAATHETVIRSLAVFDYVANQDRRMNSQIQHLTEVGVV